MRQNPKVFYFWESARGAVRPAYLDLCIETWRRNAPDLEIIHVNYGNVENYTNGSIKVEKIKRFSLPLQSDAIAVAVLLHTAGLFIDIDTVILPGFNLENYSNDGSLTVYGDPASHANHSLGFLYAAIPGNILLRKWHDEISRRIDNSNSGLRYVRSYLRWLVRKKPTKVKWNYLGNDILDPLSSSAVFSKDINILDSKQRGFVVHEASRSSYVDFWFGGDANVDDVIRIAKDKIFCLQNSWTPQNFMSLNHEEVLNGCHLLSKILKEVLK